MTRAFSPDVDAAIVHAAQANGLDPELMRTFARIESGGRPDARTGSYKGLFQLSDSEFQKHGGTGDVFGVDENANAAGAKLGAESAEFTQRYGRPPSASELYMIHQQGVGGSAAHWENPDAPAWQNMAGTAEGRQKGEGWAKQAVWGNVPDDAKRQYPDGVDSLTSRDFVGLWDRKVTGLSGADATPQTPTQPQQSGPLPTPQATPETQPSAGFGGFPDEIRAAIAKATGLDPRAPEQQQRQASATPFGSLSGGQNQLAEDEAAMRLPVPQRRRLDLGKLRSVLASRGRT